MGILRTRLVDSLASIGDARLDEICADGHTFANRRWFRMLERLDLGEIVGGAVRLEFLVVTLDHLPVAVCPFLTVGGEGAYFVYGIRRFYFEHWLEEAVRMAPDRKEHFARLFCAVTAFRKLLEWTGSVLDRSLLACNPLSYRGVAPVAPQTGVPRSAIYDRIIAELKKLARKRRLPLTFFGVEEEFRGWANALERAGCVKSFLFHDNVIDLEPFGDFDEYLKSFHRTTRRAFQRDMKRTTEAGIAYRFLSDWSGLEERFARLYSLTYGKYGSSHLRQPASFWKAAASLGPAAEMIVAERDSEIVGFCLMLHNDRRGETWTYRIGRSEAESLADVPFYFGLSFYGPIRRAIERGYRRIWLGPASYEAKGVRGARLAPLYNYHWSPRRLDRALLLPYLQGFGDVSRRQIESSRRQPAPGSSRIVAASR